MTKVHDAAAYVLRQTPGGMSTMKLQKLLYFAQGWSLALLDEPLFEEEFQAWQRGPVCSELFTSHKGQFSVERLPSGSPELLDARRRIVVDAVLRNYSGMTGMQLSELSRLPEGPWAQTRREHEVPEGARSQAVIDRERMTRYFRETLGASAPPLSS